MSKKEPIEWTGTGTLGELTEAINNKLENEDKDLYTFSKKLQIMGGFKPTFLDEKGVKKQYLKTYGGAWSGQGPAYLGLAYFTNSYTGLRTFAQTYTGLASASTISSLQAGNL